MKNLRLIAGLCITAAVFVGCAVSSDPGETSIRIDNPTVTQQGDVSTISNGDITVTTSSLSLTKQSDFDSGICCRICAIPSCRECFTCPED